MKKMHLKLSLLTLSALMASGTLIHSIPPAQEQQKKCFNREVLEALYSDHLPVHFTVKDIGDVMLWNVLMIKMSREVDPNTGRPLWYTNGFAIAHESQEDTKARAFNIAKHVVSAMQKGTNLVLLQELYPDMGKEKNRTLFMEQLDRALKESNSNLSVATITSEANDSVTLYNTKVLQEIKIDNALLQDIEQNIQLQKRKYHPTGPRFTISLFQNKESGTKFLVNNVHLLYVANEDMRQQTIHDLNLIIDLGKTLDADYTIIAGDFNLDAAKKLDFSGENYTYALQSSPDTVIASRVAKDGAIKFELDTADGVVFIAHKGKIVDGTFTYKGAKAMGEMSLEYILEQLNAKWHPECGQ